MRLALFVLAGISCLELLMWLPIFWRFRRAVAVVVLMGLAVGNGLLYGVDIAAWTALVGLLSLYRVINVLRLIEGRTQADYLFRVARKASLWLISAQLLIVGVVYADTQWLTLARIDWWYMVVIVQIVLASIVALSTRRHMRTTVPPYDVHGYADRDLPSITLAIPARNETEDLQQCLASVVRSNYPKLEILVLDDCSQERRTPEIIRQFAQDGVRFVAGQAPPEHWLPKNYAYHQLHKEANGEIIIFCGVDVRFAPDSLRQLVQTMLYKKKSMLSIIPINQLPSRLGLEDIFVQPGRYAWELALPRRWLNRPPVLSTCWGITKQALHAAGGFKAVSGSSSPESFFAKAAAKFNDGYTFVQSTPEMGISSAKPFDEQRDTAIRTRYPQLHRRPELAALLTLTELIALPGPLIIAVTAFVYHQWLLAAMAALAAALITYMYAAIIALTYRRWLWRGLWLAPFAGFYDIGLLNFSMWMYEFRQVYWKGRNVCIPVMRVIPKLPKV